MKYTVELEGDSNEYIVILMNKYLDNLSKMSGEEEHLRYATHLSYAIARQELLTQCFYELCEQEGMELCTSDINNLEKVYKAQYKVKKTKADLKAIERGNLLADKWVSLRVHNLLHTEDGQVRGGAGLYRFGVPYEE